MVFVRKIEGSGVKKIVSEANLLRLTYSHVRCAEFIHWMGRKKVTRFNDTSTAPFLDLVHINMRIIRKHWDSLNVYLSEALKHVDIRILTEINITQSESQCMFSKVFSHIQSAVTWVRFSSQFTAAKVVAFTLCKSKATFLVIAVCRPPNSDLKVFLPESAPNMLILT